LPQNGNEEDAFQLFAAASRADNDDEVHSDDALRRCWRTLGGIDEAKARGFLLRAGVGSDAWVEENFETWFLDIVRASVCQWRKIPEDKAPTQPSAGLDATDATTVAWAAPETVASLAFGEVLPSVEFQQGDAATCLTCAGANGLIAVGDADGGAQVAAAAARTGEQRLTNIKQHVAGFYPEAGGGGDETAAAAAATSAMRGSRRTSRPGSSTLCGRRAAGGAKFRRARRRRSPRPGSTRRTPPRWLGQHRKRSLPLQSVRCSRASSSSRGTRRRA
jgi:hypothetical protein